MSAFQSIYERGDFKLGWDRKKTGELRSPYLAIVWNDCERRRQRSESTGTADVQVGKTKLDLKYTEATGGACAFCPQCGQKVADAKKYLLLDALCAYFEEVGQHRVSSDSIKARLKALNQFIHSCDLMSTKCADVDDGFVLRFRKWSQSEPIKALNKRGEVSSSRQRSPATTEESVILLKAALNHAHAQGRIEVARKITLLGRKKVSPENTTRVGLPVIAKMLRYAASNPKTGPLHAFLVGSLTTLARPSAVFDISTHEARDQWRNGRHLLRLNPKGRVQTNKFRPDVPVPTLLMEWLEQTETDPKSNGWLVQKNGQKISSVKSSWASMLKAVGLPQDSEHGPYLIRRSIATLLRNWHHEEGRTQVAEWDLEAQLGHRGQSTTEVYAKASVSHKTTVQRALEEIIGELEILAPGALHRRNTGQNSEVAPLRLVA